MKVKELIRQLQQIDPSGEEEVCLGNVDIAYVERKPAYYDGRLQVLIRDPSIKKYMDIIGVEFRSSGIKIDLVEYSAREGIYDDPEFKIIGELPDYKSKEIEGWRRHARELAKPDQPTPTEPRRTEG